MIFDFLMAIPPIFLLDLCISSELKKRDSGALRDFDFEFPERSRNSKNKEFPENAFARLSYDCVLLMTNCLFFPAWRPESMSQYEFFQRQLPKPDQASSAPLHCCAPLLPSRPSRRLPPLCSHRPPPSILVAELPPPSGDPSSLHTTCQPSR